MTMAAHIYKDSGLGTSTVAWRPAAEESTGSLAASGAGGVEPGFVGSVIFCLGHAFDKPEWQRGTAGGTMRSTGSRGHYSV
jgi:hypothetical protein